MKNKIHNRIMAGIMIFCLAAGIIGCSSAADNTAKPAAASNDHYTIKVVDEASDPVSGATVQFCSDDKCKMAKTGSDGTVMFDDPEGVYTVHILKVPKGYKNNDSEYKTDDHYSDMVIVVEKE